MATKPDDLGTEKVAETSSGLAGTYTGIMGHTYKNAGKKRSGILTDFFCANRTTETPAGLTSHIIMKLAGSEASFLKDKEGKIKIDGVLVRHNCNDTLPTDPERTANFMIQIRKRFAKACGAFDEATGQINWTRIQGLAGVVCSYNMVEKDDYLNIDTKSIQIQEQQRITPECLDRLYTEINAEFERRKAAKTNSSPAPQQAPPPPSDDKEDLPF